MDMTNQHTPPMRESEESDREQLDLAKAQGEAYAKAMEAMDEESDSGVIVQRAGDYEVAIAIEEAEGMYHLEGGELVWHDPTDENCHVEVAVRDGADGRFVPGLTVHVTLVGSDGTEIGTHEQPFLWHPWLYHYGRNWRVPGEGEYTVRVRIDTPTFMRHDHENGRRFAEPVEVEFEGVEIEPDQKKAES